MYTKTVVNRMLKLVDAQPLGTDEELAASDWGSWRELAKASLDGMDDAYPDFNDFLYCMDLRDDVDAYDLQSAAEDLYGFAKKWKPTLLKSRLKK